MKHLSIAIISVVVLLSPWVVENFPNKVEYLNQNYFSKVDDFLSAIVRKPVQISDLKSRYGSYSKRINVLIVPGHEPDFGGAEYRNLKERDMNVELSKYLSEFLSRNSSFKITIARDGTSWNPVLSEYFKNNWDAIVSFVNESKIEMFRSINEGVVQKPKNGPIYHNDAPKNVAYRLYGINKWGNENGIDIAIHVHFNDYPRMDTNSPGKYSGFAIYVPESSFLNSSTTHALADTIFKRLSKYNAVSNLPNEDTGRIEDDELIAVGAYNTADSASLLIEYGYMYEPQFSDPVIRDKNIKELAYQTYLGVQDFFDEKNSQSLTYDSIMFPYKWENSLDERSNLKEDIYALQTALAVEGVYPPYEMDKNNCPRTGKIGPCTKASIEVFQKKYGINGEKGFVGKKTLEILNNKYSIKDTI